MSQNCAKVILTDKKKREKGTKNKWRKFTKTCSCCLNYNKLVFKIRNWIEDENCDKDGNL